MLKKIGIGFALIGALSAPARALDDGTQLMAGGLTFGESAITAWTSPGFPGAVTNDFPGPNKGERAVQLRMPAGVLKGLKVKLITESVPTSGTFSVMVRKNSVDTVLTCQVNGQGNCNGTANVNFLENDRLAIRVINALVGSGDMIATYTVQFD